LHTNKKYAMAHNQINAIVTTTSGIFGGVGKVFSGNLLLNVITFQSLLEVSVYAGVSAIVGYMAKLCVDAIRNLNGRRNHE